MLQWAEVEWQKLVKCDSINWLKLLIAESDLLRLMLLVKEIRWKLFEERKRFLNFLCKEAFPISNAVRWASTTRHCTAHSTTSRSTISRILMKFSLIFALGILSSRSQERSSQKRLPRMLSVWKYFCRLARNPNTELRTEIGKMSERGKLKRKFQGANFS